MSQFTITMPDGTTTKNIPCSSLQPSGKKNIESKPNANLDGPVEVQTNSYENLKFVLQGVHFTGEEGDLDYDDVLTLYKSKFTGTNAAKINVTYGTDKILKGLEDSTDIYVVLESFNFPIDMRESKDGYMPVGSLIFVETDTE